ncbi:MAG: hypothetical protein RSC91_00185 [Clostridia bacterium]
MPISVSSPPSKRLLALLCAAVLVLSTAPLYVIAFDNHPYYDDFTFSADAHRAWVQTGSLQAVLSTAIASARTVRNTWQGTYTGTLLSNVQPGVFSESYYWIGTFVILTALIACFLFFFSVVFHEVAGLSRADTASLSCLLLTLMIQLMPDVGEAFFWFNGGIGNTFIYALLALSLALAVRLLRAHSKARAVRCAFALVPLMVLLGGGSYSGGLIGLCLLGLMWLWALRQGNRRGWLLTLLWALWLGCFVYSMTAPGNAVRSSAIGYQGSAGKAILQSLYYGVAQLGGFFTLPVAAVSLLFAPVLYDAARSSRFHFSHPWLVSMGMICLFCTQLTPPLYSGVFIGGERTVDTYWISFVAMWFVLLYYLLGAAARRMKPPMALYAKARRGVALASVCLLLVGCLGYKQPDDTLYGAQNLAGPSAALSLLTGEAARYDREMTAREALLNDAAKPEITLAPLTAVPGVLMDDLLKPGATYDVRPALCNYYGKTAIAIQGEGALR